MDDSSLAWMFAGYICGPLFFFLAIFLWAGLVQLWKALIRASG
jgi:hypothetical protein